MKIVLPVHHFPPRYSAGAEIYTFRLARRLIEHGHAVEVVAIEAINAGDGRQLAAVRDLFEDIPVWRLSFNLYTADQQVWEFDNPLLGAWFTEYFQANRPDLAHFQAGYLLGVAPMEAAHRAGIPMVLTLHDYWFICPRITLQRGDGSLCSAVPRDPAGCVWCRRLESRRFRLPDQISGGALGVAMQRFGLKAERTTIARRRERLHEALSWPQAIVAPSQFLAGQIAAFTSAGNIQVCRLGMDTGALRQAQPLTEYRGVRIGYTGQIAPHKGVHLLVGAFRTLPPDAPAELHIHGGMESNPAYAQRLRAMAAGDPRITFHGRYTKDQLPGILLALDVVAVPSTWYENSPLAILEAHAAGRPVITAAMGGMAELVQNGTDGLHFAPNDTADLAAQLKRLLDEPALLPTLRAGIRPPRTLAEEMEQLQDIYRIAQNQILCPAS